MRFASTYILWNVLIYSRCGISNSTQYHDSKYRVIHDSILLSYNTNRVNNRFCFRIAWYKCESFKKLQNRKSLMYHAVNRAVYLGLVKTLTFLTTNFNYDFPLLLQRPKHSDAWRTTMRANDKEANCKRSERRDRSKWRSSCGRCIPTCALP